MPKASDWDFHRPCESETSAILKFLEVHWILPKGPGKFEMERLSLPNKSIFQNSTIPGNFLPNILALNETVHKLRQSTTILNVDYTVKSLLWKTQVSRVKRPHESQLCIPRFTWSRLYEVQWSFIIKINTARMRASSVVFVRKISEHEVLGI